MTGGTPSTWRERMSAQLTWHYAIFAALAITAIVIAVRIGLDWAAINRNAEQVVTTKQIEYDAQELQTKPLRGLNEKVDVTRTALQSFYQRRVPPSYSSIAGRFAELAVKSGVHLSRVQYTQGPPGSYLTEISMDAGISGDYPQIMRFINSLEREQTFFVIRGMALTGQSGGLVNLRLRVSTWLRPADAAVSGLPSTTAEEASPAGASSSMRPEVR
jgi:type IV pilus assembly protein PilO